MRRSVAFGAALGAVLVLVGAPASAQSPQPTAVPSALETTIREISFDSEGQTRLVVSVAGSALGAQALGAPNFTVTEGGTSVSEVAVEQLFASKARAVAVALLMDASGSVRGDALAAAKASAKSFVSSLPAGVRVAVIRFGGPAAVVQDFTVDRAPVQAAIDRIAAGGRTTYYDSVVLAAGGLGRQLEAQRNMVVFSDGNDTESRATLQQAVDAVTRVKAPATTVLLQTQGIDETALRRVASAVKGGRFLRVADTAQLSAAFGRAAQAIASQYVITYSKADYDTRDLNIGVSVNTSGFTASDASVVLNQRQRAAPNLQPPAPPRPIVGFLSNRMGFYLGVAAAFIGVLLFIGMLVWQPAGKRAERMLSRRLRLYSRGERKKDKEVREQQGGVLAGSALGRRALELVERVPRSKQFDERMQRQLDQAGWPLRTSEFVLIQVAAAVAGFIIGVGLLQRWWLGLVLAVFGSYIPRLVLAQRMAKRSTDFLAQLPENLQLLAGSLEAGYGFMQAIDTVAKESHPPTSTEFARVLAEARLGMPLEDALDAMADRVGGEDFRWVVLAINIQRQVGGNLATLLNTVANTLREREMVRRQIKVLSAEGRLSAVILVALPFILFGYLSVVNPEYLGELTGTTTGKVAIVGALGLIGLGALWMRKIIKIDV